MKCIDKSTIAAEIERRKKYYENLQMIKPVYESNIEDLNELLSFLDALEVKEVDLEKEFDNYTKNILACDVQFEPFTHLYNCAKHFFELGLKAMKG